MNIVLTGNSAIENLSKMSLPTVQLIKFTRENINSITRNCCSSVKDNVCIFVPRVSELLTCMLRDLKLDEAVNTLNYCLIELIEFYREHHKDCSITIANFQHLTEVGLEESLAKSLIEPIDQENMTIALFSEYFLATDEETKLVVEKFQACTKHSEFITTPPKKVLQLLVNQKFQSEQKINEMKKIINENQTKKDLLEIEARNYKSDLIRIEAESNSVQRVQIELKQKCQALQDKIEQLEKDLIASTIDKRILVEENNNLKLQVKEKEKLINSITEKYQTCSALSKNKQKELDNYASLLSDKEKLVVDRNITIERLEKELLNSKDEIKSLVENLLDTQEMLEEGMIEKIDTYNSCETLSKELDNLKEKFKLSNNYQNWLVAALRNANRRLWAGNLVFRREVKKQSKDLAANNYFDVSLYTVNYPDVAKSKIDPIVHYLLFGAYECRNPSTEFNTLNYIQSYSDVANAGINPLLHFMYFGKLENRKANPFQKLLPPPSNRIK